MNERTFQVLKVTIPGDVIQIELTLKEFLNLD